jgi:hypothetical protein
MNQFDRPSPQQHEKSLSPNSEIGAYENLDGITRALIEGVAYDELPDEFSLDGRIAELFTTIRESVDSDKNSRSTNPLLEELKRRVRQHYQERSDDPNAQAHLSHVDQVDEVRTREFSQKMYLVNGEVVSGQPHRGEERSVGTERKKDGIDDEKAIVDIHTHPSTSPFSRGDFGVMLKTDQNAPEKCVYLVAAGEINLVGVIAKDAVRKTAEELREELKLKMLSDDYHDEVDRLIPELPEQIEDGRQRQFVVQFLDILKKGQNYRIGIYVSRVNESGNVFKRISSIDDIVQLSKEVAGY